MSSQKINTIVSDTTLTISNNIVPTYATPVATTNAIGYCGLTKNGIYGFTTITFKAGGSSTAQTNYIVGTTLLPVGTYFITYYLSFSTATTLIRALLVSGSTNVLDNANTTQTAWSASGYTNLAGSGIISTLNSPANSEFINSTYFQATTATPYVGLSVAVDNGVATTVGGTYSIGYMRIA